ncbi:MAG: response regulator [Verrucomicrobia bacterium]|nr:response regulator [Verrucomicrobiota bacterium]
MPRLKRILLAEDDTVGVELTLTALAQCGLADRVDVVRDGGEALDYLYGRANDQGRGAGMPAVLLLDLKMPKVGGLEVLRRVRADEKLARLPVVMLTSSRQERDLIESYRLGVNAYVVKPIDFDRFIDALTQVAVFWALVNEPPPEAES